MPKNEIVVADVTIREGMQYFGMMFSLEERMRMLEFQEMLAVDMSQAAYPPAHITEREALKHLHHFGQSSSLNLKVSGLCRALVKDVDPLLPLELNVYSLHTAITRDMLQIRDLERIFQDVTASVALIRDNSPQALIEVNLIDIGKTDAALLKKMADYLIDPLAVDILILPDTSGVMAPNILFEVVQKICEDAKGTKTRIGVHCHNDLGMASANTVMGVVAGAQVVQLSALGLGERNGIGDLFTVGKCLSDQGYQLNLNLDQIELFKRYYEFVDELCREKLNIPLLTVNTPYFGLAVATHVAGMHGLGHFGIAGEAFFQLNVLCGKHLVRNYLENHHIAYEADQLQGIATQIKNQSVKVGRALLKEEVMDIVLDL